eukprot:scaffold2154_cov283-Chaetoceros_neogracile.AAC.10
MKSALIILLNSILSSGFQPSLLRNARCGVLDENPQRLQNPLLKSPPLPFIGIKNIHKGPRRCVSPRPSSTSLSASLAAVTWVASSTLGGMLGAPIVIKSTKTWYKTIPLPTFTPPNSVFGPVWTTLYIIMGIASWRIKSIVTAQANLGAAVTSTASIVPPFLQQNIVLLSCIHYVMNISWAQIFFGLKRLRAGHVLNVALLITLIPLIAVYYAIDPLSGIMLVPYLAWIILATRLSSGVCKLNPTEVKNGCWYNNAKLQDQIWELRKEAARNIGL